MIKHADAAPCRVVVLLSGEGSNLQAILDAVETGQLPIQVNAVISNRPESKGLERARRAGLRDIALDHQDFERREDFDSQLKAIVEAESPQLVVLAGFLRILTPVFVDHFAGRLINLHPSLLPKYPGLHPHQQALDAGDSNHGCTVHFVDEVLDGGPRIIQASVPILPADNADTLATRVRNQEHLILPLAIRWYAEGRLKMARQQHRVLLDGEMLPSTGFCYKEGGTSPP